MSSKSSSNNKVISLISGNGTGKTSLAECLLYNSKWKDFNINLIDCLRYMDFIGQTQAAIKVIDSMLLVVDVKSGVQAPTELVIEFLTQHPKPMFCILNKLDLENIDYFKAVKDIKSEYNLNLVPITAPVNYGENFSKIVDILQNQAYEYKEKNPAGNKTSVDENIKDQIENHHNAMPLT